MHSSGGHNVDPQGAAPLAVCVPCAVLAAVAGRACDSPLWCAPSNAVETAYLAFNTSSRLKSIAVVGCIEVLLCIDYALRYPFGVSYGSIWIVVGYCLLGLLGVSAGVVCYRCWGRACNHPIAVRNCALVHILGPICIYDLIFTHASLTGSIQVAHSLWDNKHTSVCTLMMCHTMCGSTVVMSWYACWLPSEQCFIYQRSKPFSLGFGCLQLLLQEQNRCGVFLPTLQRFGQ